MNPAKNRQSLRRAGAAAGEALLANGASRYERGIHLPRLLPLWSADGRGREPQTTQEIVAALRQMQRRERARAGLWTYDLNRHIALMQAIAAELSNLAKMKTPPGDPDGA